MYRICEMFFWGQCGQWGALLGVLLGYLAVLVLLGAILPGRTIAGAILADNSRLYYKCNGEEYPFHHANREEYIYLVHCLMRNVSSVYVTDICWWSWT